MRIYTFYLISDGDIKYNLCGQLTATLREFVYIEMSICTYVCGWMT